MFKPITNKEKWKEIGEVKEQKYTEETRLSSRSESLDI